MGAVPRRIGVVRKAKRSPAGTHAFTVNPHTRFGLARVPGPDDFPIRPLQSMFLADEIIEPGQSVLDVAGEPQLIPELINAAQ